LQRHQTDQIDLTLTARTRLEMPGDPLALCSWMKAILRRVHDEILRSGAAVSLNLSGGGQIVLTGLPQGTRHRPHSRQLFRAGPAAFEMCLNFSPQILVKTVIEV
jgi:hypothetical protein